MSKPKRNPTTLSKPSGFSASKSTVIIKVDTTEQKIVKQVIKLPQDITFGHAMQGIQMSIANELINESREKFVKYTQELQELAIKILEKNLTTSSSHQIVEYIEALITIKSKVMAILSWGGTIANLANHLVSSLDVQATDELLNSIAQALEGLITMFDSAVNSIPNISILGITLSPDQKQVSETKSLISNTLTKIEKIKQEIAEGYEDWGAAEQSAYERLMDDKIGFVSGEEVMDWIEQLKAVVDV